MSTTSLGVHKFRYLWVGSRILKRNYYESAQINGVEQHHEQSRRPSSQQWILKKAEWPTIEFTYWSVSCWLHFLTWTIWYRYLYTKNYKAVYTYHQVFCCTESVNTKRENPMVYGANFTQCVCTGYCESWILSLLSFIMNSWYHRAGGIGPAASVLAGSAFSQGKSNNSIFAKGK